MPTRTSAPRGLGRTTLGTGLKTIGIIWLALSAGALVLMTVQHVREANACGSFKIELIPSVVFVAGISIPGWMCLFFAQRTLGANVTSALPRAAVCGAIVAGLSVGLGTLWPKPGPPCHLTRGMIAIVNDLRGLVSAQAAYHTDSNRFATSVNELVGAAYFVGSRDVEYVILWADSASWGAYGRRALDTDPNGSWVMCGAVMAPPNHTTDRTVEGVRLQNACWDPRNPKRVYRHRNWDW